MSSPVKFSDPELPPQAAAASTTTPIAQNVQNPHKGEVC
jgi:hypothetical protein